MIYNINIPENRQAFREYGAHLISQADANPAEPYRVELIKKHGVKTPKQNRYMHVLFAYYAMEYGERKEWVKQEVFKKIVNPEIFRTEYVNKKTGEMREDWRSVADLNSKEATQAIERFRNYAMKEAGIYLPEAGEYDFIDHIENMAKQNYSYI